MLSINNWNKRAFFLILLFIIISLSYGNELRMIIDSTPLNLDPRIGTDQASQRIHQIIFNGLFKKTKNFFVEKDLLKDYSFLSRTKILFKLKKGVLFHNGKELTAKDVKWTFDSLLSKEFHSLRKGAFKSLKRINVIDRYTLLFELKYPDSSLIYNLVIGIVPYGTGKDFFKKPIGTGPFMLQSVSHNRFKFKAFPKYFKGKVFIDNLYIKVIKDPITRVLTFKKGNADLAINCIPPDFVNPLKKIKELKVLNLPGNTMYYLGLNLNDRYLKNIKLREALSYSINYEELIKFIMKGYARRAYGLLPPEHWAYTDDIKKFHYSPNRAKTLLKESGLKNIELEFKCTNKKVSKRLAVALKYYWEKLGIKVHIKIYEFSRFYRDIIKGNFQVYPLAWVGILSPDIYIYTSHSKFYPPYGANRAHYKNQEVDTLLDNASKSYDINFLKNTYGKVEKIISADIPFIPLWFADNLVVYSKKIKDLEIFPSGEYYFLEKIHMEE